MTDLRRWPEADAILEHALDLSGVERARYLEAAAGNQPELLAALRAVLEEAESDDGFLPPGGALDGALFREVEERFAGADEAEQRLAVGTRIGPYEVVGELGRGGMGEVYRARDTQLGREVALKVLPTRFNLDRERTARFEREARVLAALNHPNIGAIYGFAEFDGVTTLVLELVEGPTLADLIEKRSALGSGPRQARATPSSSLLGSARSDLEPVDRSRGGLLALADVLSIARQIAAALEAAHARGIVHRDLKPANLKVTTSGVVKVLDFGLSKALEGSTDLADSLTKEHRPGAVLGTAAYMSPEQVRGQSVDLRTDIWTFGCVLFEALTGRRAFSGDSAAEVVGKVLEREPDFDALPAGIPDPLRDLIRQCLTKDLDRRLSSITEARALLDRLGDGAPRAVRPQRRAGRRRLLSTGIALAAAVLIGVAAGMFLRPIGRGAAPAALRVAIGVPAGDEIVADGASGLALSPNGRVLVYRARRAGVIQLFDRRLDAVEPVPIAGTEAARAPFFSPDGRWLGYINDRGVWRLPADGGVPRLIARTGAAVDACWTPDGTLLFASGTDGRLYESAAGEMEPSPVVGGDVADGALRNPQALPDGRGVLLEVRSDGAPRVAVLERDSGALRVVTPGTQPRLLASGHLVIHRRGSLWVAPFDPDTRRLLEEPVQVVDGVRHETDGAGLFAIAPDGLIAYVTPGGAGGTGPSAIQVMSGWSPARSGQPTQSR